jgi:hypothetical protein
MVHFPGAEAQAFHTFSDMDLFCVDFLMKGGRAVMFPLYKGTYERNTHPTGQGASEFRDETIQRSKDMRRSLDYLETRPDIDHNRLAFYGFSWGGVEGPISLALEFRFKTAVLADGGCNPGSPFPEVDPINFAPNIKIPVLMINGAIRPYAPYRRLSAAFFPSSGHPILGQASCPPRIRPRTPLHAMVQGNPRLARPLSWPCELVPGSHRPLCLGAKSRLALTASLKRHWCQKLVQGLTSQEKSARSLKATKH